VVGDPSGEPRLHPKMEEKGGMTDQWGRGLASSQGAIRMGGVKVGVVIRGTQQAESKGGRRRSYQKESVWWHLPGPDPNKKGKSRKKRRTVWTTTTWLV